MKKKSSITMILIVIFSLLSVAGYNNSYVNNRISSLFVNKNQQGDLNKSGEVNNKIIDNAGNQSVPAAETKKEAEKTTVTAKTSSTKPKNAPVPATKTEKPAAVNQTKVQTNAKVVVIDPGHGGTINSDKERLSPDSNIMKAKYSVGAVGFYTKTPEYQVNLEVSLKLANYLRNAGYKVILTRTSNSQTISNIERAEIGNKNNADLVIRIHADGSSNHEALGASMLVPGSVGYAKGICTISKKYGDIIQKSLVDTVGMKNRGVKERIDLTGFNWSKVPVVLVEMGFLSNVNEDRLLSSNSYQEKIAKGLFYGINKALK